MLESLMAVALSGLALYIGGAVLLLDRVPWVAITIYWGVSAIWWTLRAFDQ